MPTIFSRFPVASVQGVIVPILVALVPVFGWAEGVSGAVNVALMALGGVVAAGLAILSILVASWTHTQVTATRPASLGGGVLRPSGVPSVVRR